MAKTKFPAPSASAKAVGYLYKTGLKGHVFTQSPDGENAITTQEQMIDAVEGMIEFFPSVEADLKTAPGIVFAIVEMPTRTSNAFNTKLVESIKGHRTATTKATDLSVKPKRKRKSPIKKGAASIK